MRKPSIAAALPIPPKKRWDFPHSFSQALQGHFRRHRTFAEPMAGKAQFLEEFHVDF